MPDFYPFSIWKLGMIDTQATSEHSLQTFGNLGGQGNFRQQVQHLFTLLQRLLYQMNIDFCLTTGSDPMKKTHVLLSKILKNSRKSLLLWSIQNIELESGNFRLVQSTNFLIIDFEDTFIYQSIENGSGRTRLFQQFFLGNFLQVFTPTSPTREFHIFHQYGQLFFGSGKFIEQNHHTGIIQFPIDQSHTGFCPRLVTSFQIFLHKDGFLFQQSLQDGKYIPQANGTLQLGHTLFLIGT